MVKHCQNGSQSAKMDEIEGRTLEASDVGSAPTMFCNTCPGVRATAFCVDCHEYLCTDCTGYHQRLKLTKTHTLLTDDEFPSVSPPERKDHKTESSRKCPDHPNEKIKFYCQGHSALCCVACTVLSHEQCTKVYIPDIAEDFRNGPELEKLNTDMQCSDQLIVDKLAEIEKCLMEVDTLKVGEMHMLKMYRERIIEYLDRRENELQAEMKNIHDEDAALLHELQTQLTTCQSELKVMRTTLKSHEKNSSELFIAAKRVCSQLAELQSSLQETTGEIGYRQYSLELDPMLKNSVQDEAGFAVVHMINGKVLDVKPIIIEDSIHAYNSYCMIRFIHLKSRSQWFQYNKL